MFSEADVAVVRHVVQRILVPCVFVIGLLGNSVSIYVLTRKRMRCTTNIYLTALAITDIMYLTMVLVLSLQHYQYMHIHCEIYWKFYGLFMWLCDACAYISIYIAVCFTIERFIAIRYPLKRQTFCTESLAKKVIASVALFCLLSTISTAFEHQYRTTWKLIDNQGNACNLTLANEPMTTYEYSNSKSNSAAALLDDTAADVGYAEAVNGNAADIADGSGNGPMGEGVKLEQQWSELLTQKSKALIDASMRRLARLSEPATNIPNTAAEFVTANTKSDYLLDAEFLVSEANILASDKQMQQANYANMKDDRQNANELKEIDSESFDFNITEYCQNVTYYMHKQSSLALNDIYKPVWYFFTLFTYVLIPLCVLATFNCILIMLVRRSKSLRGEMTNASSIRRTRRKTHVSSVSQENRVTITLIAVVLLFIVCQLPWAVYLILSENMDIEPHVQAIIGNIFNLLTAINAASNFFLYCVLSDKYRQTIRELITGYKYRKQRNTLKHTSLYANSHAATMSTTLNGAHGSRRCRPKATSMVIK